MKKYYVLILFLILAIAIFFRFWHLETIPPGLYPDEAANGVDVIKNLEGRPFQVFYTANNGREGLFINIQTLAVKFFGNYPWALRGVSGVFGVLTILGIFLLSKEMFGAPVGLLASFFMAISFWHVNFSRIGFRAILMPFFITFALFWFLKGWRKKSWFDFSLSGIVFGLGFYSYIAYRISPLIFLIPFIFWTLQFAKNNQLQILKIDWWKKFILQEKFYLFILWSAFAILVTFPFLYYFYQHPSEFFGRASETSLLKSGHPFLSLGFNVLKVAGMFNFVGDHNWRHNMSGWPELFWPVGILFALGTILGAFVLIKSIKNKDWQNTKFLNFLILFGATAIMLVPSLVSTEAPHALRSLGAISFVFIFVGIGAFFVWEKLNKIFVNFPRKKLILNVFLFLFLLIITFGEGFLYFKIWANRPEVYSEFRDDLKNIGILLNELPQKYDKIVIVNQGGVLVDNFPVQAQTIQFITYQKSNVRYILPDDISKLEVTKPAILIPLESNPDVVKKIKEKFKNSKRVIFSGQTEEFIQGFKIE